MYLFKEENDLALERVNCFKAIGPNETSYTFTSSLKDFNLALEKTQWGFSYVYAPKNYGDAVDQVSLVYHENDDYSFGASVVNESYHSLEFVKVHAIHYLDSKIVGVIEGYAQNLDLNQEAILEFLRPLDSERRMIIADEVVFLVSSAYYREE